ncbi:MAG TPA: FmdB family zinc ribbon protein [Planctomycetota bacterium]|jgi:putative FmdB family regulatory protein|nr:FmdB family zinc ribbon protein [Planctomycetota bacterium]
MPTYDYECGGCRHTFEVFEGLHAQGLRECPKCGKKQARRLIGIGAGLVFKGSGFYVTDYKRSGGGNASEAPAKSEKKDSSSSESRKT